MRFLSVNEGAGVSTSIHVTGASLSLREKHLRKSDLNDCHSPLVWITETFKRWIDSELVVGYVFLMPYVVFLLIFLLYPMVKGLYISLHEWNVFGNPEFIGLANYTKLFADDKFWSSLSHTLYFVLLSTIPLVCLSLLFALGLDMPMCLRNALRGMFFFPYLCRYL